MLTTPVVVIGSVPSTASTAVAPCSVYVVGIIKSIVELPFTVITGGVVSAGPETVIVEDVLEVNPY